MHSTIRRPLALLAALFSATFFVACHARSDYYEGGDIDLHCRANPAECEGELGGACARTEDCADGVCCKDKNCGGGMCAFLCDRDADCPDQQRCEHGYCFFACSDDGDCGPGQSCEHGKTICEYEE